MKNYDSKNLINYVTFYDASKLNDVFYINEISFLEKKLISMEREYARKLNMYELKLSASMTDILIQCIRHAAFQAFETTEKDIVDKILNYLHENYNKILTNQEIAAHFHYLPNYINSLVKRYTGLPLHQYIKSIRITKAADMLTVNNKSIQEGATACGFYDSSHFIKCFKEMIGMTPKQYQNNY